MEDEISVIDLRDNSIKRMARRYAEILRLAQPLRYQTRELRAEDSGSREITTQQTEESERRKPGRPRKNLE